MRSSKILHSQNWAYISGSKRYGALSYGATYNLHTENYTQINLSSTTEHEHTWHQKNNNPHNNHNIILLMSTCLDLVTYSVNWSFKDLKKNWLTHLIWNVNLVQISCYFHQFFLVKHLKVNITGLELSLCPFKLLHHPLVERSYCKFVYT